MHRRAAAFAEPVVPIGICHVIESFAKLDEAVDQPFGNLDMRVGLTSAVNDQEVSFQAFGEVDWRRPAVSSGFTSGVFM